LSCISSLLLLFFWCPLLWYLSRCKLMFCIKSLHEFLISNFRLVLYVVCFLLGNSPTSEFYMPTFWNTVCSIFIGR
jgi:hypothetical protein